MTAAQAPLAGVIIADKYRLIREIGRGGMGVVLEAEHVQLGTRVAVKLSSSRASAQEVARFKREAGIVARLTTEHVCRVLDLGSLPSGEPFIVMELLVGEDLAARLGRAGPLRLTAAVDCLLQALEALAEAHAAHVVHRDLKPSNLFVSRRVDGSEIVKVLDFGISKSGLDSGLTSTGAVMGSPRFMSPEQLKSSRDVDARSDLWSLGIVLYELLAGRPAFGEESAAELVVAILQEEPTPLRQLRPDVPPAVEELIARCLRKEPSERFPTVADLALALLPWGPPDAAARVDRICRIIAPATPRPPAPPPHPAALVASPSVAAGAPARRGRKTVPIAVAGLVAAAIAAGVALLLARGGGTKPTPSSGSSGAASQTVTSAGSAGAAASQPTSGAEHPALSLARGEIERREHAAAKRRLEELVEALLAEGAEPKTPQARSLAQAFLLLGDIERATLQWPEARLLENGTFSHDTNADLLRVQQAYGRVIPFWELAILQCSEARMVSLYIEQAAWIEGAKLPTNVQQERLVLLEQQRRDGARAARENARDLATNARLRPVPKGEGCRAELDRLEKSLGEPPH